MEKLISVLTPTYNRANKLHRVYNSIKKQTLKKVDEKYIFKWVIVDDGSSDNTKELVEKWQKEVDWEIIYVYQENKGKPWAIAKGLEYIDTELTLIADSDDEFLPESFETFYNVWKNFLKKEKRCNEIGVLCQNQFGKRMGCNFPKEGFVSKEEFGMKWKSLNLGETWSMIKSEALKKVFLNVPKRAKKLKFIPESFFWDRMVFEVGGYVYSVNKVLRIYYVKEENNMSANIRKKYPEGFFFESKYFITHYPFALFKYPKIYFKHLLKTIYFGLILIKRRLYG